MITGNPVRQDLFNVKHKREEALSYFKLDPSKRTILIIGGSGGARTINESIGEGLHKFDPARVQLLWQTGKNYYKETLQRVENVKGNNFHVFEFISRMDLAYAAADIVISRAGASSVSEICNLGMACILVPSPNVAEDHQTKNAMALVEKKAAVIVKDAEARLVLVDKTISLLANESELEELKKQSGTLAHYDSANLIAKEVLKLAKYKL